MEQRGRKAAIVGLLSERADYVSGAEMAKSLGVTRSAVWKKIALLKTQGYVIESSPVRGYRLIRSPELSLEEIGNSLAGRSKIIGKELLFFETVHSTNAVAVDLVEKGHQEGTVIIANGQTGGKGRLGRVWFSPPGKNLYMSVILKPQISPRRAALLTLMSAVACASAVRRLSSLPISIKWPNDIVVGDRKLGGILTETKADMDRIHYAVLGIGINVNLETGDLPDSLRAHATSIKHETGMSHSRTEFATEILWELDTWYGILLKMGGAPLIEEWLRLTSTVGQAVRVVAGDRTHEGLAEGIDDEGLLIVRLSDNSLLKVAAGDVQLLRALKG